jgi:hypothetical protein
MYWMEFETANAVYWRPLKLSAIDNALMMMMMMMMMMMIIIMNQFFIIYVPSLQPQGQLQTQRSVDTSNYIMDKHNIKSKTN